MKRSYRTKLLWTAALVLWAAAASAQDPDGPQKQPATSPWKAGAFLDSAYAHDFNHPANDLFRSRGTTYKVDEPLINIAAAYFRKTASEESRWGFEATFHAGQDSRVFGFSPTAPNLAGSKWLRHLGPTDVTYLLPVGKGLNLQSGIFGSLVGYDSLYAKDNFNYTRPWMADSTPYFMMGINASYPLTDKATGTVFVINDYFHLAHPNSVPSWGGQIALKPGNHWTVKETALIGPHQRPTSLSFWRFLSDTIVEWKRQPFTVALNYQSASEQVAVAGKPRSAWVAAQLPAHWIFASHWSATVRPEVAWDNDGRWTGFPQTVKAVTATLEDHVPIRDLAIVRLEYRFDDSRGSGGGFFRGREVEPGIVGLTPSQHLLIFAVILTVDGQISQRN